MAKRVSRPGLIELRLKHCDPKIIYAGLLYIAKQKNYQQGWARWKFKELFGKWPRPTKPVEPAPASSDLVSWVCRGARNYGFRKARAEAKANEPRNRPEKPAEKTFAECLDNAGKALDAIVAVYEPSYRQASDMEALEVAMRIEAAMLAARGNQAGE